MKKEKDIILVAEDYGPLRETYKMFFELIFPEYNLEIFDNGNSLEKD